MCRRCDGTLRSRESGRVEKKDVHTFLFLGMGSGGEDQAH